MEIDLYIHYWPVRPQPSYGLKPPISYWAYLYKINNHGVIKTHSKSGRMPKHTDIIYGQILITIGALSGINDDHTFYQIRVHSTRKVNTMLRRGTHKYSKEIIALRRQISRFNNIDINHAEMCNELYECAKLRKQMELEDE